MPATPVTTFSFQAIDSGNSKTSFDVLTFEGEEDISRPFEYRLTLKHPTALADFSKVVNQNAELVMEQEFDDPGSDNRVTTEVKVAGVVATLRAKQKFVVDDGPDYVTYEAVLVPKLWRLGLFHQSRIFQNRTVEQIIGDVFAQEISAGVPALSPDDYSIKLDRAAYEPCDFCVQYRESDLAFIQRLMEHEGIYYFFDQGKLIITDSKAKAEPESATSPKSVSFKEGDGGTVQADDVIFRFQYDERVVPRDVRVRDYDYEAFASSEEVPKETATSNAGSPSPTGQEYARVGTHYEHGLFSEKRHFNPFKKSDDPDLYSQYCDAEGKRKERVTRIADVRAQELEARRISGQGKSNVLRLQAGHVFKFVGDFPFPNGASDSSEFLVTSVHHRYHPIEIDGAATASSVYRNAFTCLPTSLQYRPPRATPVPRVPGVMTAKVVSEPEPVPPDPNDSKYSDPMYSLEEDTEAYDKALAKYRECLPFEGPVDEEGKYRLQIPFDAADQQAPSKRVRLAQPHAGTDYGFHFPNRPDSEMVFACVDGDPDRPLGLSMVANPWTHSPVPTTARELRTQNPWTGALEDKTITYDEYKNVIRTARGHQIVMDDNDASSNVGITIQTGSNINESSISNVDVYWKTRIEMGGYRVKSGIEQVIDGVTEAFGWLKNLVLRDLPSLSGMIMGMAASHVESGNYGEDTFGTTTPVGIDMKTDQAINIKGLKGVNITSPNLFGMFSSNFVGDSKTQKNNQHAVESIAKGIKKILWQEVANEAVNDFLEVEERRKSYESETSKPWSPHVLEGFKVRENFYKLRIRAFVNTILNRTGVNVFSAGELKMASLNSATVVAGDEGMLLKSFGPIEQKANTGVDIKTDQGISIKATGRQFEGKGVVKVIKGWTDDLKKKSPVLGVPLRLVLDLIASTDSFSTKDIEDFGINIHNESGAIHLHTGGERGEAEKGAGDIMMNAHGTGNVRTFSRQGLLHSWSGAAGEAFWMEVGKREKNDKNNPLGKDAIAGLLRLKKNKAHAFSSEEVVLNVGKDYEDEKSSIKIEEKRIAITCGESSIVLNSDGLIEIIGKDIMIEGSGDVSVEGMNVDVVATQDAHVEGGMSFSSKGKMTQLEGEMFTVKGKMTQVSGQMIKVG
jgi:Rhs element Vgr protein